MAHLNLGNALAPQGKTEEAIAAYRAAIRLVPDFAESHCALGNSLREQGDYPGALAMLRRGHELGSRRPKWRYPSARWLREAERSAAVANRLPAVLKGDDRPRDPDEPLAFARMCYDTRRFAAAARLFAEALAADPKLADDWRGGHRYNAACAAALAAAGQGRDDPPPDGTAKARLRGQAFDWLRAERDAWARRLDGTAPGARPGVAEALRHWQTDSDLAGVRDAEALARLPAPERDAWRALWDGVAALLKKAEAN